MQYLVKFVDSNSCDKFATLCGLTPTGTDSITAPISLLPVIKADANVTSVTTTGEGSANFIIKAQDVSSIADVTVIEDLGNSNYIVSTTDPLALYDAVSGKMDPADVPVKLMSTIEGTTVTLADENANWARLRVTGRYRPFPTEFRKIAVPDYKFKPELFIVDSGVNFTHPEFDSTEIETIDFFTLEKFSGSYADTEGHGTAMASAAAGINTGLHQHLRLMNVKIFGGDTKPTLLEIVSALNAILVRHTNDPSTPRTINCSWVTTKSFYLEEKFQDLIDAGIVVVAAAGNFNDNVENYTPAGLPNAITVAASDIDDIAAGFNNFSDVEVPTSYGQLIDIFAPGVDVTVASYDGSYIRPSGTSPSAAYTSGAIAAIQSVAPSLQTPESILIILLNDATRNVLLIDNTKFPANANKLLHLIDGDARLLDPNMNIYLGLFSANSEKKDFDLKPLFLREDTDAFGETSTYELVWDDADIQTKYQHAVTINSSNGMITVEYPNVSLPTDKILEAIGFRLKHTSTAGVAYSYKLFFYSTDPDRDASGYDYMQDETAFLDSMREEYGRIGGGITVMQFFFEAPPGKP